MKKLSRLLFVLLIILTLPLLTEAIGMTGWEFTRDLQKIGFISTKTQEENQLVNRIWILKVRDKKITLLSIEDKVTGCLVKFTLISDYGAPEEIAKKVIQHGFTYLTLSISPAYPPTELMAHEVAKLLKELQGRRQPGNRNVVQKFTFNSLQCQLAYTDNDVAFVMAIPEQHTALGEILIDK
jgi:hypothetical protein